MSTIMITADNFEQEIIKSQVPVLLDFYADWCGPCKMLSPIIDKIAAENNNIKVAKINVDKEQALAQFFDVMSIPTLVVMKNGTVTSKATGYKGKDDILAMLQN